MYLTPCLLWRTLVAYSVGARAPAPKVTPELGMECSGVGLIIQQLLLAAAAGDHSASFYLLWNVMMHIVHFCAHVLGCNNGVGGFHENLVTFWGPKLPGFS